jgi:beta-lactamase regulating signal transducer with metallopeptidase domain
MELGLVISWVIKSSIMASIWVILILLVKYALRNKLDAKWQYAIWILLIIRLLIPYDIQSPWSIYSLLPNNSVTIPMVNQAINSIPDINAPNSNISGNEIRSTNDQSSINKQNKSNADRPTSKDLSNGWIIAVLWLAGVLILAILIIAANLRFYLKVRQETSVTDARISKLMEECTLKLGIRKNLPIICMYGIDTPCLYGIISPKLLLPKSLINRLNDENIRHIFIHELSHYKRNDILINWLAVAAQIVHWFNPLIWYSFARMREDCELACDANTLSYLLPEEYLSYGLSIISLVTPSQSPWLPGTTGFFGNKNNHQIKRRLTMIKKFRHTSIKWSLLGVLVIGLIASTVFTSAKVDALSLVQKIDPVILNPIIDVNSMLPAALNNELVQYARKNREGEYAYSNENDLASIAIGRHLGSIDEFPDIPDFIRNNQIDDAVPAKPIFVKSYDGVTGDYYIVPFVQDQKFVKITIMKPLYEGKAFITDERAISPRAKLLEVDANEAVAIMKQVKGVGNVPNPRLIFYREPPDSSQAINNIEVYLEPYWEFTFADKTRSYVTQSKQVVTKDIAPWYETYVAPKYNPQEVKIEPNKLIRDDGWMLNVTKITLAASPYDKGNGNYPGKSFEVYFDLENANGKEKGFMPQGKILGVVGTSGKLYELNWGDRLDQLYIKMQRFLPELAKKEGKPYEPGIFKIAAGGSAEANEQTFAKVIYQDEQGNKFEIPIQGIKPELTYPNPDAK